MPWRLVSFFLIFAVFLVFILSNLENKSDISFIKWTLKEIPVFVTVFGSFAAGMICSIPLIIAAHFKAKKKNSQSEPGAKDKRKNQDIIEERNSLDEER
ncbi:MAG: nuclear envelope integral membrane protein [Spirochaetaceae bacterium]|jgi:uncharacterized integral membrane protein|nr:nuclear envelope integral membrane protein [Spirochaetaceae bacterium]